jgi:nucleoside-diphosphate-sugar epimerase
MKIAVFGATGGVGRLVVEQAIAGGHDVVAVVRDPTRAPLATPFITADLQSALPHTLEAAVSGADAVVSAIGPPSNSRAGIASTGTRAIVNAMGTTGVSRIVVISASPVATVASSGRPNAPRHDPGDGLLARYVLGPVVKSVFRQVYDDLARMEDVLRESAFGLDGNPTTPAH